MRIIGPNAPTTRPGSKNTPRQLRQSWSNSDPYSRTRPDNSNSMNTYSSTPAERYMAYNTIYGYFRPDTTQQQLLEQLLNLFEAQAVGALGIFVADLQGEARLRLVHGLRKHPGSLAQANVGELVQFHPDMLAKTSASRVLILVLGHHIAELDAHRQPSYLIPLVPEEAAHAEGVSAYKVFFIPFELLPFLIGTRGLTPYQAMGILYPYLNQKGLVGICAPLFATLRVAGTFPTNKVLYRDLPSLNRPQVLPGDLALTVARLLLLRRKLEEADLPPIYRAWAQKSKHENTHMVFQSQVATRASELGIQAPLVTTAVLKRFQDSNFHGTNPFDVADGILPLAFIPLGGSVEILKREQKAATNVAAYNTIISIEGNLLTSMDSLELQKIKAYIPVDSTEATAQLESYLAQIPLCRAIADEIGELITPAIESAFTIPSPDFGEDFHKLLCRPDPPHISNTGSNSNINNNHSSCPGVRTSTGTIPAQARLANPNGDPCLKDTSNHPIVKKLEASKMREVIQAMRDKGKCPLSRSDGQERCHLWHIKGVCFSSSSRASSGNGAKRHMPERPASAIYDLMALRGIISTQKSSINQQSPKQKLQITHELGLALNLMPPKAFHAFCSELGAIQATMQASVTELYAKQKDAHWNQWVLFCLLLKIQSPSSRSLQKDSMMADCPIATSPSDLALYQTPSSRWDRRLPAWGPKIPEPTPQGFKGYAKLDPAPSRVKPVPITLVMHALRFAYYDSPSPPRKASIANMICIAFFFCLHLGEYTGTTRDDQAFLLRDVSFYLGSQILPHTSPLHELQAATSVTLTFTTHKNGDKGEVLAAHARSGDSLCCPVAACACQVLHLQCCCPSSSPFSPHLRLASSISNGVVTPVRAETVTSSMRVYAQTLYHTTGISPAAISARSL
eukprot:jgi/Psemu1/17252/gm1.17252_g